MLNRSRSWPVQSVITLDPRGIIRAKVQEAPVEKFKATGYIRDDRAKPDIVLEAKDRLPLPTQPDIFLTVDPKLQNNETEPLQIKFVDHYQVLDSVSGKQNRAFVVSVSSEELSLVNNVPEKTDKSAFNCSKSDKIFKMSVGVENYIGSSCEICRQRDVENSEKIQENEENQFLSSYQIDILRKSLRKRRESSFDLNCSLEKDYSDKTRKPFERKLTSDFESIASNETKTTDCDACGLKRNSKRDGKSGFHLIRSYSLGHEKTRQKLTGTFKKFSLPTPIIQQKEGNENPETSQENKDCAPKNINLDKRKVTTLTRHYYPEGGWGYVIVTCSVMVHILCHGLQLAAGMLMILTAVKFHTDPVHTGENQNVEVTSIYFCLFSWQRQQPEVDTLFEKIL